MYLDDYLTKAFYKDSPRLYAMDKAMQLNNIKSLENLTRLIGGNIESIIINKDEGIIVLNDGRKYSWNKENYLDVNILFSKNNEDMNCEYMMSLLIKPGNKVVEVGTCWGRHTVLISGLVGGQGIVHAFEPVEPLVKMTQKNLKLNGCENIIINNLALSNYDGESRIFVTKNRFLFASLSNGFEDENSELVCRVTTLNRYLETVNTSDIDIVKIDIEGGEMDFIEGASHLLGEETKPLVIMEVFPHALKKFNCSAEVIFEAMKEYGYRPYVAKGHRLAPLHVVQDSECIDVFWMAAQHEKSFADILSDEKPSI